MIKVKHLYILPLILGSSLFSACQNKNAITPEATCDPSLGPCGGIKEKKIVFKDKWPSFDALCSGQNCKIVMTNEFIQVGGTRLPRSIILNYSMQDNSDYSCTSSFTGGACNPILIGNIYYQGPKDKNQKAIVFEFRNYKPVSRLNTEMKQWFGDQ